MAEWGGASNFLASKIFSSPVMDNLRSLGAMSGRQDWSSVPGAVFTGTNVGGDLGSFISNASEAALQQAGTSADALGTGYFSDGWRSTYETPQLFGGIGADAYKLADASIANGATNLNFANSSDDELTSLFGAAGGLGSGLGGQFGSLMAGRAFERQTANDAYQKHTLGGNYAGGILPEGGYKDTGTGSFGMPQQQGQSFSTGQQPNTQPTGFGYPNSGGFGGWGGPSSWGSLSGQGGFSSYKNPFEPV